jgi:nicotinamide riboside kinase
MRRFHDSLVRGFWRIMVFDGFRSNSFFCDEFYGRAEEVVEESPFVSIEVVEERYDVFLV